MTSPVVWDDAFARATAAAGVLGLVVLDATAQNRVQSTAYVLFETAGASVDRIGVGEIADEETGQIMLHLMVPSGSGAPAAIAQRKQLSTAFRRPDGLPVGLYYDDRQFDPPDADQPGNWVRFSLLVDYRYQDIII